MDRLQASAGRHDAAVRICAVLRHDASHGLHCDNLLCGYALNYVCPCMVTGDV